MEAYVYSDVPRLMKKFIYLDITKDLYFSFVSKYCRIIVLSN